jgi:ABC-type uncharacterized transport system involved in gliding motility auxiliary subunit
MQPTVMALLGLASLVVGFVFALILPGLRTYAWGTLAFGAALLTAAVILDFKRVKGALVSRRGRFGLGTTVKISLFSGIILLINAISVGTYHRFDFTGLAQFTLTSQTKEVLAELDKPVEVVNFFTPSVPPAVSTYAQYLLDEYQIHSDQLTVRTVDPDLNPDQARQYQVDQIGALYGVTVFRSEEGQRQVYGPQISAEAEHAFTSAILEVTGIKQKKVYFLTGHGESGIYADYDSARSGLRDNLFEVGEVDLLRTPEVPEDAAVLVLAGPQQPLVNSELEVLSSYLDEGGRLMVLVNPGSLGGLGQLLGRWSIAIGDGVLIDPSSYVAPDPDTPLVPRTRNTFRLGEIYFPGAAAVIPLEEIPADRGIAPLAWSSPESWLEREFKPGEKSKFDERTDKKGPLAIGALISTEPAEGSEGTSTRLVVIGDSDFAANRHFRNGNNADLFLSSINWLAEGEEIIAVDRKVLPIRRLILGPEQVRFLHISSIGLLPLLLLVLGGIVWWRRR